MLYILYFLLYSNKKNIGQNPAKCLLRDIPWTSGYIPFALPDYYEGDGSSSNGAARDSLNAGRNPGGVKPAEPAALSGIGAILG